MAAVDLSRRPIASGRLLQSTVTGNPDEPPIWISMPTAVRIANETGTESTVSQLEIGILAPAMAAAETMSVIRIAPGVGGTSSATTRKPPPNNTFSHGLRCLQ